jgi:hypothetical protein
MTRNENKKRHTYRFLRKKNNKHHLKKKDKTASKTDSNISKLTKSKHKKPRKTSKNLKKPQKSLKNPQKSSKKSQKSSKIFKKGSKTLKKTHLERRQALWRAVPALLIHEPNSRRQGVPLRQIGVSGALFI